MAGFSATKPRMQPASASALQSKHKLYDGVIWPINSPEIDRTFMTAATASTWRLITSPPLSGAENMALDEALLDCFIPGFSPPVLRLYSWQPPALSLGRFQQAADVLDMQHCQSNAVPVVRRITGGGVIYHADELTYSLVCTPGQIPQGTSIKDSFRILTGFLLTFYRALGLTAEYAVTAAPPGSRLGERTAFCFAGRESFDILLNGHKIGGNAQRRLKNVIFQHGSIPLLNRAATGLSYMLDRREEFSGGTTSLDECGITADLCQLTEQLTGAFMAYFAVSLQQDVLSEHETAVMGALLEKKYLCAGWNLEGVIP